MLALLRFPPALLICSTSQPASVRSEPSPWAQDREPPPVGAGSRRDARHQQVVRILLDAGADPGIADRDGVTALEHAQRRGYGEIAQILRNATR